MHLFPRLLARMLPWAVVYVVSVAALPAQTVPSGGERLVTGDIAVDGGFYGGSTTGGVVAERTVVDVAGPGFTRASRIEVLRPTGNSWSSALYGASNRAVANGDVVLVRFFLRAIQSQDETGTVPVEMYAEGPGPNFTRSFTQQANAGGEWTEFFMPFEVNGSYASGEFRINFGVGLGERPRVLEIGGIEVWWYGKTRTLAEMPRTSYGYEGRAADAAWRAAAALRIEQYRKANYAVRVVDEAGQPVPGARVRVRLRRHAFPFGTAIQAGRVANPATADDQIYRQKIVELFSAAGPENDLKWPPWEGNWGSGFNQGQTLAALAWLQAQGLRLRGHVLVWPSSRNLPNSINDLPRKDPSIPERVRTHIQDVVSRTKDYLVEWDVLNEPYDNNDLMQDFGNGIMAEWFKEARKHHPTARLFINEYGIISGGGINGAKQQAYEDTIRLILEQGGPLGGIGVQGHMGGTPTGIPRVLSVLDRYAQAFPTVGIAITEFDVDTDDEEMQADYTRDFITAVFSHPQVTGFQMWGFWEEAHWREAAAMYRTDWSEKPNGRAYRELVHGLWRTDETQSADAAGVVTGRGFHGEYDITVSAPGRAGSQRFTLTPTGGETTVVMREAAQKPRLVNISTRGEVGTGEKVMIAGFYIRGHATKEVVIRAVGPELPSSLSPLEDPQFDLHSLTGPPITIDGLEPGVSADFERIGAAELAPGTLSAAAKRELNPYSGYTAVVKGKNNGTGMALVEVYDAATGEAPELVNIATRGFVGANDSVLIAGFYLAGEGRRWVLIRGVGPGLPGSIVSRLADPRITLVRQATGATVAENNDWESDDASLISQTSVSVGAVPFEPGSKDAALLVELEPGGYTVIVSGVGSTTGVGLVEVYAVD